ncbi:MAG: CotH kinase family protein [Saprospiraceae bacterium]|nr:CotH kinase family protein [Saprospiraceae bacterium]
MVKANFVKLYINDQYWGIYLNVQQLNKDFLEEWYASNDGNNFRADSPTGTTGGGGGGGGPQWEMVRPLLIFWAPIVCFIRNITP